MTCAGLTALLVGSAELQLAPGSRTKVEEAVRDGLAWMQMHWEGNGLSGSGGAPGGGGLPTSGRINSYLVYGLERMGVLGGLRTIGEHDWYAEGARRLVEAQAQDGSWSSGYGTELDTAFCLLFLCRGTREAYGKPSYEVGEMEPRKDP